MKDMQLESEMTEKISCGHASTDFFDVGTFLCAKTKVSDNFPEGLLLLVSLQQSPVP